MNWKRSASNESNVFLRYAGNVRKRNDYEAATKNGALGRGLLPHFKNAVKRFPCIGCYVLMMINGRWSARRDVKSDSFERGAGERKMATDKSEKKGLSDPGRSLVGK